MKKQIQKLKEEIKHSDRRLKMFTKDKKWDRVQAEQIRMEYFTIGLQTWKQALTLKLKDVEKDIEDWRLIHNQCKEFKYEDGMTLFTYKKLSEKQSSQAEIIKELGEIK